MTMHTAIAADSSSQAWDEAMQAFEQAQAEYDNLGPTSDRCFKAWEAGRPAMDCIHWSEFRFRDRSTVARIMDLDAEWEAFLASEGKTWWASNDAARQRVKARFCRALSSVREFRAAEERNNQESGWEEASRLETELCERACETEDALMSMPAPHLPALLWKIEKLLVPDADGFTSGWSGKYVAQTMADARKLLSYGPTD